MIFGFNTDVPGKDALYHVQTEDRGEKNPVIDSIIYVKGRIVDRRRTTYVPSETTTEEIQEKVRQQHRSLVESIRSGAFIPSNASTPASRTGSAGYAIQLLNAQHLSRDEQLLFDLLVQNHGEPADARDIYLEVRWVSNGAVLDSRTVQLGDDGRASIAFQIPPDAGEGSLLVCATGSHGREFGKFRVRPESK